MIYTCTLNPALDYIINLPAIEFNRLNRIDQAIFRAGGKGINVSVVLNNLGIRSIATGFLGDFTGSFIKKDLKKYPFITMDFIDITGTTRMNLKLNHGFKETEINDSGPQISEHDFQILLSKIEALTSEDLLICSGSTCQGQSDAYQRIAQTCSKHDIKFVMDVPGKDLLNFISSKPLLIKPNLQELESYFDVKIGSMDDVINYGKQLIELGAENVLISMGSKGSLFISQNKVYRASLVHGHTINTTGAGDSMIAGFISSYIQEKNLKKAYLNAVSAGSATVFGHGLATMETVITYQKKIKIKEIYS
ncbi:MAG: 1-phosphofructokinase [Firmicutes bacterium]|nr:1-phosphofructokinase [Bacillota bacterium]